MMLFFCVIIVGYAMLIGHLLIGFGKIDDFKMVNLPFKTKFSIIVPFRNEVENLSKLLLSFQKLNFPVTDFEVILIDDDSDNSFDASNFNFKIQVIKNVRKSNSPKKDAIDTAIKIANFDWIVTTDADCVVGENWLKVLDQFIQKNKVEMVVGAVKYESNNGFLYAFQSLDNASLQGVTIGSFGNANAFMCNGANFAYTKFLYKTLKGFENNNHIASGDDVFLLQKALVVKPQKVLYLKSFEHIVTTKHVDTWRNLLYQRVRWASKTAAYQTFYPKFLGLLTLFANVVMVALLILLCTSFQSGYFILVVIKIFIDGLLISKTNHFFKLKTRFLIFGSLFYPVFFIAVGIFSLVGKYDWKGRKF